MFQCCWGNANNNVAGGEMVGMKEALLASRAPLPLRGRDRRQTRCPAPLHLCNPELPQVSEDRKTGLTLSIRPVFYSVPAGITPPG